MSYRGACKELPDTVHAALRHLHRILKPGGVLLLTSHGIVSEDITPQDLDCNDPDFEVIAVRAKKYG